MRRFFTFLFVISLLATGAVYYWRTYEPEKMVVASAPMVILYISFQKYFIRGLMAGAIK